MNESPSAAELQSIADALAKYPNATITGAALGMLVRDAAPTLNLRAAVNLPVGTGALARFVDGFLPQLLSKVGQTAQDGTGGDNVYQLIRPTARLPSSDEADEGEQSQDFWNAFVRPSDPRRLYASKHDGTYQLACNVIGDTEGAIHVGKVTPEEFKQLSEDFIAILDATPETAEIASQLRNSQSYSQFVEILKVAGSAFFVRWSEHRRERVRRLFLERLAVGGLPLDEQQRLLTILDQSQESARHELKATSLARATATQPRSFAEPTSNDDELTPQSRDLLLAVINRMSTQEIRSLSLPFGHVMDALQSLTRKK